MDDYSWFVGIIEGEAYFGIDKSKKRWPTPEFSISMCDLDIMEKLAEMLDCNIRTFVPKGKTVKGTPYKTQHSISIRGRKAWALMERVEPHLSVRRKEQIKVVRENYKPKTTCITEGYVSVKKPVYIPLLEN